MADEFNLGRHEALIAQLVNGQHDIVTRLGAIEHTLAEKRGERRVSMWLLSAGGGIVGSVATIIAHLWSRAK